MRDAIAEVRYQALRAKLNELRYYQPLSVESSVLAEQLLNDLIASVDRHQELQKENERQTEYVRACTSQLNALQVDNPRLQAENNTLHLEIIEAGEEAERQDTAARLRLKALEDEIEAVHLAVQRADHLALRWEREADALRAQAQSLLKAQAGSFGGRPAPLATRRPAEWGGSPAAPAPRVPYKAAQDLEAQAAVLSESLQQCERQTATLEAEVAAESHQVQTSELAATELSRKLAQQGPDSGALRQKADASLRRDAVAALRAAVAHRSSRSRELEQRCDSLRSETEELQAQASVLESDVRGLAATERQAAERAGELERRQEELASQDAMQLSQGEELQREAAARCRALEAMSNDMLVRIARVTRDADLEREAFQRAARELELEAQAQREHNERERSSLGARAQRLRLRVETAEAACADVEASEAALESQVVAAQASAEECLRQLERRTSEIHDVISDGAELQHHSQRSSAQVELWRSSLHRLMNERDLLRAQLTDKQSALHSDSLQCHELKLQVQRYDAVLQSLASTKSQWSHDLDTALGSLQQAYRMQEELRKRRDHLRGVRDGLLRQQRAAEEDVAIVSKQREALAAEVEQLAADARQERSRAEEVISAVSQKRAHLQELEEQVRTLRSEEAREEWEARASDQRLQGELQEMAQERSRLEQLDHEENLVLHQHILQSEADMARTHGELETLVHRNEGIRMEMLPAEMFREEELQREHSARDRAANEERVVRQLTEARGRAVEELQQFREVEHDQAGRIAGLRASIADLESRHDQTVQRNRALELALEQQRVECRRVSSSETVCNEELHVSTQQVSLLTSQCDDMHKRVADLIALVSGVEESREQLATALSEEQAELERQRRASQRLRAQGSQFQEEHRAVLSEVQQLRQAAVALDGERDEQQRLADIRTEEISELKQKIADHQHVLAEAHKTIDERRSCISSQAEQLAEHREYAAAQQEALQMLQGGLERIRSEAQASSREALTIMEDLMHMTKENQSLHEEVRIVERRVAGLASKTRNQLAEQESSAQQLQLAELERADMTRLYQQVTLQCRQQATLIEQLRFQVDGSQLAAGELGAQLARGQEHEQETKAREEQLRLDISVMEEQLQGLAGKFTSVEMAHQAALSQGESLEAEAAVAAAARRNVGQLGGAEMQAVSTLLQRRYQIQCAIQQLQAESVAHQQHMRDGASQTRRLQELLEEERRRSRQLEAESRTLREVADSSATATTIGGSDIATLESEVERRYARVGELDAEQQRLSAEAIRLRAVLRERRGPGA